MIKKYSFIALFSLLSFFGFSQTNYEVNPIPFQQYLGSSIALSTNDDSCSPLISLPFTFNFYGQTFNQIVVSTNGYIDFRSSSANGFSPWSFSQTIPNANFPVKNSIFGAFQDLNNSNAQGTITYGVYGTTPSRKFVVYFDNNSLFSCATSHSSFQIILYESNSIIDVQLIDKQTCPSWNGGNSVTGIIDNIGTQAVTPPNRNTGSWTAFHEGWRFTRPNFYSNYSFVKCDDDNDGLATFDLTVAQNDLSPSNPSAVQFFETATDAQVISNPINTSNGYLNISQNTQTLFYRILGTADVKTLELKVIDCAIDIDSDTVSTDLEDINADTNLANDDTDNDGLPNYLDNDDDGDLVLTNVEYAFPRNATAFVDTDADGIQNYLDNDDDGDGILTFLEDSNGDGNPTNDDTNSNGTPDYLENSLLTTLQNDLSNSIKLYPNPTSSFLNIDNSSNQVISSISIFSIKGDLVEEFNSFSNVINVSKLQSGIYFVKIQLENNVLNYKFIKK